MKPSSSFSWLANKLLKLKSVVFPLIKLRLEDGLTARFWYDNWSPLGSLAEVLNNTLSRLRTYGLTIGFTEEVSKL